MDHPEGARETGDRRLGFDRRVRLEFRGSQLSPGGGLLLMRKLDAVLELSDFAPGALNDSGRGKNTVHRLDGLFRQSVYGRLAGRRCTGGQRLADGAVPRQRGAAAAACDGECHSDILRGYFEMRDVRG